MYWKKRYVNFICTLDLYLLSAFCRAKAEQTEAHIYDAISQQSFHATDKKADQLYCEIGAPASTEDRKGFSMSECAATRVTVAKGSEADEAGLYESVTL